MYEYKQIGMIVKKFTDASGKARTPQGWECVSKRSASKWVKHFL